MVTAIVVVAAGLVGFLVHAALRADDISASRERELVNAFLRAHATHMLQVLKTAAGDAEATADLTGVNQNWFLNAFGKPLNDDYGFEQTFLVDGNGKVLQGATLGRPLTVKELEAVRPALAGLVRDVAARNQPETGVLAHDGLTGLAAVQKITPKDRPGPPSEDGGLFAVTVDLLNDNLFNGLGAAFRAGAFKLVESKVAQVQVGDGENALPMTDLADGHPLVLTWATERPVRALLARVAPPVAVLSSILFVMCAAFLVQARRTAGALAQSEARAVALAAQDALTGLSSRAHFIGALDRTVSTLPNGDTLALMFVDLDGFKDINDTLGHASGDMLLCEVARRLRDCLGPEGLVARFGGDEFVLMASPRGLDRLPALLEGLLKSMREPMRIEEAELCIGASIGAAVAPIDAETGAELMRLADIALYRAKAQGRGGAVRFEPFLEREVRQRRQLETELVEAIATDQFALVFQPQVEVESERIVGFEALLRWDHPRRGRLLPGEFLPVAEGTQLITRIDNWVLRNACLQARAFGDVTLAVNMSPVNLRNPLMSDRVLATLEETGFDPARLELEITESAIIGSDAPVNEALGRLRAKGVRLALDDFGTDHASLVHVRRFPITKIKIDRSFIANLGVERDAAAIVEYVVRLGRSLGITLTAEGVETREQLRFLRAFGAQQAQGFLFAPPLPAAAAMALLTQNRETLATGRRGADGTRRPS